MLIACNASAFPKFDPFYFSLGMFASGRFAERLAEKLVDWSLLQEKPALMIGYSQTVGLVASGFLTYLAMKEAFDSSNH